MKKPKEYDHSLGIQLETASGDIRLAGLVNYTAAGLMQINKDYVWLEIDGKCVCDNPDFIIDIILPALNEWKKYGIEPNDYSMDYVEVDGDIPADMRKAVRRIIKDGIHKGFFKKQTCI